MLVGQAAYMTPGCLSTHYCMKKIKDGILDDAESLTISGKQVPVCLVGDSAYPISTWLMKPFSDNSTLSPQQKHFNYRLSRARAVVEMAFGRLKA